MKKVIIYGIIKKPFQILIAKAFYSFDIGETSVSGERYEFVEDDVIIDVNWGFYGDYENGEFEEIPDNVNEADTIEEAYREIIMRII